MLSCDSSPLWCQPTRYIGFSGAYTLAELTPLFEEACEWLPKQAGLQVAIIVGHWDKGGLGADEDTSVPGIYDHVKAMAGCTDFDAKQRLKFVMGHTHVRAAAAAALELLLCDDDCIAPWFDCGLTSLPNLSWQCNVPHPHGHGGTGFMVAGQGMLSTDCEVNYGIPIFDTTGGNITFWYFPVANKNGTLDNYDNVMACVVPSGWRACTHLATKWLEQPL